jgi:hypothetical protein
MNKREEVEAERRRRLFREEGIKKKERIWTRVLYAM